MRCLRAQKPFHLRPGSLTVLATLQKTRRTPQTRANASVVRRLRRPISEPIVLPPQGRRGKIESETPKGLSERMCRVISIAAAIGGILVALPLMLAIALAVKLSSPGPVLYTQPRVGINLRRAEDRRAAEGRAGPGRRKSDHGGRIFTIYKFRTMRVQSDQPQVWASSDDPRITWIGGILRKSRLDELPQLFNVLRGDMNVVGPRPEQPEIFRKLRSSVGSYADRQRVLPGITGWAQINHAYDQCVEDVSKKVAFDLEYISKRSPVRDLAIMAKTVPVMVGRKGAV